MAANLIIGHGIDEVRCVVRRNGRAYTSDGEESLMAKALDVAVDAYHGKGRLYPACRYHDTNGESASWVIII